MELKIIWVWAGLRSEEHEKLLDIILNTVY